MGYSFFNILSLYHLKPGLRYVGDINGSQTGQKAVSAMTYHNHGLNFPSEDITGFP